MGLPQVMLKVFPTAALVLVIGGAGAAPGLAQTSAGGSVPPAFASASIEPSSSGLVDHRISEDGFVGTTVTLTELIQQAYGLHPGEIVGGPNWVRVDRFTVRATAGEPVAPDRVRLMLQTLLAGRFKLQLAREIQTVPLYRLTAGAAHKLKSTTAPGQPPVIDIELLSGGGVVLYEYRGRNVTMSDLARALALQLPVPVVDMTNLAGRFDFRFTFTYDDVFGQDTDDPTVFEALERRLGLQLVAGEGPLPVYVVRSASRPVAP